MSLTHLTDHNKCTFIFNYVYLRGELKRPGKPLTAKKTFWYKIGEANAWQLEILAPTAINRGNLLCPATIKASSRKCGK